MASRLIIDGNSVYEIDEECELRKQMQQRETPSSGAKEATAHRAGSRR